MANANTEQFDYGDQLPPGLGSRLIACFVVAAFLIATVGTGIADVGFPVAGAKVIGAEAKAEARLQKSAHFSNGSLARLYEHNLRLHSRVRPLIIPTYALLKFAYLSETPSGVTAGEDNWLFLDDRILHRGLESELMADSATNLLLAVDRRLQANGIELNMLPIPRKSYIARASLPPGVPAQHEIDDLLIDQLIANGVRTIDLREALAQHEPLDLYFELDTHWTPYAARLVGEEIARFWGELKPKRKRLGKLLLGPPTLPGVVGVDLVRRLGINTRTTSLAVLDLRPFRTSNLAVKPEVRKHLHKPSAAVPTALAGTSFSVNRKFAAVLSHFTGRPIFDGALAAEPYGKSLTNIVLAYSRTDQPKSLKRVLWEAPIALCFNFFSESGPQYSDNIGRFFAATKQGMLVALQDATLDMYKARKGQDISLNERAVTQLVRTPNQLLAHSGDGAASLAIAGDLTGEPAHLMVNTDGMRYSYLLEPGPFQFVLPLLASEPTTTGTSINVLGKSKSRIRVDSLSIVHEASGHLSQELISQTIDGRIALRSTEAIQLGTRSALVIRTERINQTKAAEAVPMVVKIFVKGSEAPREFHFDLFQAGAAVAIDLGEQHGERLARIELVGLDPTKQLAQFVQIKSAVVTGSKTNG